MVTELLGKVVAISKSSYALPFGVWDITVTSRKVWVYAAPDPLSYFDKVSKPHLSGRTTHLTDLATPVTEGRQTLADSPMAPRLLKRTVLFPNGRQNHQLNEYTDCCFVHSENCQESGK